PACNPLGWRQVILPAGAPLLGGLFGELLNQLRRKTDQLARCEEFAGQRGCRSTVDDFLPHSFTPVERPERRPPFVFLAHPPWSREAVSPTQLRIIHHQEPLPCQFTALPAVLRE